MEKQKLAKVRVAKGLTQQQMADLMFIDISSYSRKEKGQTKIRHDEWEKLSEILETPLEDIYESEEANIFIYRDNAVGNYLGTNNIYSIPEYLLETQRKYIEQLEKQVEELKQELQKS